MNPAPATYKRHPTLPALGNSYQESQFLFLRSTNSQLSLPQCSTGVSPNLQDVMVEMEQWPGLPPPTPMVLRVLPIFTTSSLTTRHPVFHFAIDSTTITSPASVIEVERHQSTLLTLHPRTQVASGSFGCQTSPISTPKCRRQSCAQASKAPAQSGTLGLNPLHGREPCTLSDDGVEGCGTLELGAEHLVSRSTTHAARCHTHPVPSFHKIGHRFPSSPKPDHISPQIFFPKEFLDSLCLPASTKSLGASSSLRREQDWLVASLSFPPGDWPWVQLFQQYVHKKN